MLFKSTYNELLKIAYKPRSYIGVGGIILIIAIIVSIITSSLISKILKKK
jgi:hypothetical protein